MQDHFTKKRSEYIADFLFIFLTGTKLQVTFLSQFEQHQIPPVLPLVPKYSIIASLRHLGVLQKLRTSSETSMLAPKSLLLYNR